jgi:D-xylose transport system substrate-binding protein
MKIFGKVLASVTALGFASFCTSCGNDPISQNTFPSQDEDLLTIGLSFDSYVIERWTRDRDVFCATANDLGAEVNVQSANGEMETQITQIQYFIDIGVDAIVIVTIDADGLTDIIKSAKDAGIPVICYDRIVRNADADLYISFDNESVGTYMAEAICDEIGDGGNIVEITGPVSDHNVVQVMDGFEAVCEEHDENILYTYNCDSWRSELAYDFVNDNIDIVSEADIIMCGNDALAGEAVHALAERGLAGQIKVVGQDADLEACQRIVEGTQLMTVYKPVEKLAKLAAESAVTLAEGRDLDVETTFNDGTYDIPYVAIESIPVEQDNIDEVIIDSGFHQREDVYMNIDENTEETELSEVPEET